MPDICLSLVHQFSNNTIAGGEFLTLFIKSDGSLWAMGGNDEGHDITELHLYKYDPEA